MIIINIKLNKEWLMIRGNNDIEAPMKELLEGFKELFRTRIQQMFLSGNEIGLVVNSIFSPKKTRELLSDVLSQKLALSIDSPIVECTVTEQPDEDDDYEPHKKVKNPFDDHDDDDDDDDDADGKKDPMEYLMEQIKKAKEKRSICDDSEEKTAEIIEKERETASIKWLQNQKEKLVGCSNFLSLLEELRLISSRVRKHNTQKSFAFQHYLFAVNYGYGYTTYTKALLDALTIFGLREKSVPDVVNELVLDLPKNNSIDPREALLSSIRRSGSRGRVYSIDISRWLHRIDDPDFRDFLMSLSRMENNIYIFRVPFLEKEVLDRVHACINDLIFVKCVSIPPMKVEDMAQCAKGFLKEYGYDLTDDAVSVFNQKVIEEKSDGRFYGLNTVKKIVSEFIYQKQLSDAQNDKDDTVIDASDLSALTAEMEDGLAGIEQLKEMVGMEEIVKKVEEIIASIRLSKTVKGVFSPSLHMRFLGNPGTGKTTVARLIGKTLAESGVLRNGSFFEISGRDLVGRYIGETAPKTAAICRDAYGSVLFIDEAYSLYRGDENKKDFGIEALETLIAEMENHRDDLVVIMAGYDAEMQELMNGNKGLESRMPYVIKFPNYNRKQLFEIFKKMIGKIRYADGFLEEAKLFFDNLPDTLLNSRSFSNARYVRNIVQSTCSKAATRMYVNNGSEFELTKEDFRSACNEKVKDDLLKKKPKTRIGF